MTLEFSENLVLGLKSNWRLRPEQHQAALYKHSLLELSWRIIPLTWALALGLMDGVRPLKVLVKELMGLLDIKDEEQARAVYQALIKFSNAAEEPFLVEIKEAGQEITSVNLRKLLKLYAAPASKPKVSRGRLEVPIQPLFMPTNLCQTNCMYCYAERLVNPPDSMLPLQRWIEIIDELAQLGIDMVGMSGGDPMIFPGIYDILERLAMRGIYSLVPTKSTLYADDIARLAEICGPFITIQISIDGVTPAIVDRIVDQSGFCERTWRALELLIKAGVQVRTNSIITPMNVGEVPALVRKLRACGVKDASISGYNRSHYRHSDDFFLSEEQMNWMSKWGRRLQDELGWPELKCKADVYNPNTTTHEDKLKSWPERAGCSGGRSALVITPTGDVILCEQVPQRPPFIVGSVKKNSVMEVWHSKEVEDFILPERNNFSGTACFDCQEFDSCHQEFGRCFRDSYFVYNNIYHPPPNCPWSPPSFRLG